MVRGSQIAITFRPQGKLVERASLLAGDPEADLEHPRSQGLPAHLDAVPFVQGFGSQSRSEIAILRSDQFQHVLPDTLVRTIGLRVYRAPYGSVHRHPHPDSAATAGLPAARSRPALSPPKPRYVVPPELRDLEAYLGCLLSAAVGPPTPPCKNRYGNCVPV